MATNTKIEWCQHTGNLWHGCVKVHAGCDHCYAEVQDKAHGHGSNWGPEGPRWAIKDVWGNFLKWQQAAAIAKEMHFVFVGSMMDIFEKSMPTVDAAFNPMQEDTGFLRQRFFHEIVPACPNLVFLLLTKRPSNIKKYVPEDWLRKPPANVMYGYSPVDAKTMRNVWHLLEVPGRHFLSMEPLIGPVNMHHVYVSSVKEGNTTVNYYENPMRPFMYADRHLHSIDWVITGGESGLNARVSHPQWYMDIRDACLTYGVPYFHKQWGQWGPVQGEGSKLSSLVSLEGHDAETGVTIGDARMWLHRSKYATGAMLEGIEYKQRPIFVLR